MRKYKNTLLLLAMLLTISGQVFTLPMTCSMPNMTMPMMGMMDGMEMSGHENMAMHGDTMDMDATGDDAELSEPPVSNCERMCEYCLGYNTLVQKVIVLPVVAHPQLHITYKSPFIPSSALDHPFRPPKAA